MIMTLRLACLPVFAAALSVSLPAARGVSAALAYRTGVGRAAIAMTAPSIDEKEEWKLLREMRKAIYDYELIQPGDKICVAVSGGKDSSTLAYLLKQLKERRLLPFDDWSFITMHLDQVQPGHDPSSLAAWLEGEGMEFHLVREDTYSVVVEKTKPGQSYCSLCSRLRRGILYTAALGLGCNRLALGHHRDDALETLFLNMCHQGQTKALPARYVAARGIDVIRPLIYLAEDDVGSFAKAGGFPVLPCNLCGSQPDGTPGQRQQMKLLLAALDAVGDGATRGNMLRAISDVRPTHLLDRELRVACGLDKASGALRFERGRDVAHCAPSDLAADEVEVDAADLVGAEDAPARTVEVTAAEEQLRADKDAEIERLRAEVASLRAASSGALAATAAVAAPTPSVFEVASTAESTAAVSSTAEREGHTRGTQRAPAAGEDDARRSRFRATTGPLVHCAPSVAAYDAGARQLVQEGDGVLEIGCQLGRTTTIVADERAASFVVGVDMDRELNGKSGRNTGSYRTHATPAEAGLPAEAVELHLLDPWDTLAVLRAVDGRAIDVLLIDVNSLVGNDLALTALALARQLARVLPTLRTILLKSRTLAKLERQLVLPTEYAAEAAHDGVPSGWLPRIIPAVGVNEYRAAALAWLSRHPDSPTTVFEIGCHVGTSTAILDKAVRDNGGFCAGVDVSRSIVDRAGALHPTVSFAVADAWDAAGLQSAWRAAVLHQALDAHGEDADDAGVPGLVEGPRVLCVDVGGVSSAQGELDGLALVQMLTSTFGDTVEAVIVKSHCLRSTARTLQPIGWTRRRQQGKRNGSSPSDAPPAAVSEVSASRGRSREEAIAQHLPGSEAPTRERLRSVLTARHAGVALVVENCRKENVATIARTAEVLGVGELHLVFTPDQVVNTRGFGGYSSEVRAAWLAKLSKSATDWIHIEEHSSIDACAAALRDSGCELLVATSPLTDEAVPLYGGDTTWARRCVALMFGSEGSGLSSAALNLADLKLTVPQVGMTQSLNVAACAAIVLSEVLRLRSLSDGEYDAPRLSDAEQQTLETELMPIDQPPRLHNKAKVKFSLKMARAKVQSA